VIFRPAQVAVEVRGCFWHACEAHGTWPKANGDWWSRKLLANRRRDEELAAALNQAGWALVVVWEHDDPERAADVIVDIVADRRGRRGAPPSIRAAASVVPPAP
jgi:DNA mismatch endonuclease (patch repair protein)